MKARLLPLKGKYYGTRVEVEYGERHSSVVEFWLSFGEPSDRELESIGATRKQWDNDEKIESPGDYEPESIRGIICDSHYETVHSYEAAMKFVNAINS